MVFHFSSLNFLLFPNFRGNSGNSGNSGNGRKFFRHNTRSFTGIPQYGIFISGDISKGKGFFLEIISYGNKETENFDLTEKLTKKCKWRTVSHIARRKLDILIYGINVDDFKVPPGNRFELLKGNLKGYASIRINDQWRIIFIINKQNKLENVEIVDYH